MIIISSDNSENFLVHRDLNAIVTWNIYFLLFLRFFCGEIFHSYKRKLSASYSRSLKNAVWFVYLQMVEF